MRDFLSEKLFTKPEVGLELFNSFVSKNRKLVKEFDMYDDGTFLAIEVENTEKSKKVLSEFILDFDKYDAFCKDNFTQEDDTSINLTGLQYLHEEHFGKYKGLKYDREDEIFVFAESFTPIRFR